MISIGLESAKKDSNHKSKDFVKKVIRIINKDPKSLDSNSDFNYQQWMQFHKKWNQNLIISSLKERIQVTNPKPLEKKGQLVREVRLRKMQRVSILDFLINNFPSFKTYERFLVLIETNSLTIPPSTNCLSYFLKI